MPGQLAVEFPSINFAYLVAVQFAAELDILAVDGRVGPLPDLRDDGLPGLQAGHLVAVADLRRA